MRRFALVLVLAPVQAAAVEGYTVLNGPEIPILESVAPDFPRYDLTELCKTAWPANSPSTESARTTCKQRQSRLAGLTSKVWNDIPPAARVACVKRSDAAKGSRYFVLYACANAASYRVQSKEAIDRVEAIIARQTGKSPVDRETVGSIR